MDPESASRWQDTASFRAGPDGWLRPYLWLEVTGPGGGGSLRINGLIDSGADTSLLPIDYATLLGYTREDLEPTRFQQVEGHVDAWIASTPSRALVPGGPPHEFELRPLFVAGALNVLWGRADFMAAFDVSFSHASSPTFTLTDCIGAG